jgi:hypothetical protein
VTGTGLGASSLPQAARARMAAAVRSFFIG